MGVGRAVRDIARFNKIAAVLIEVGLSDFVRKVRAKLTKAPKVGRLSTAEKLRLAFEKLGPTFIKFGQLLSVRPDLVPKEYIVEFSKLQDKVPPFSPKQAKAIIEKELGKPLKAVFKRFDSRPLSGASIGQVHRATLRNGKEVVVKVQRPNIRKVIEADLDIIRWFAEIMSKRLKDYRTFRPSRVVEEFSSWIQKELDYLYEARNAQRFYENFRESKKLKVPRVYWEYTTKKVLTLERIKGEKLKDAKLGAKARKKVVRDLADVFAKQVLIDGFFHADPHPSNIIITKGKKLALVDFGIAGFLDPALREKSFLLLKYLLKQDVENSAQVLADLNVGNEKIDKASLKESLRETLNIFYNRELKQAFGTDLLNLTKIAGDTGIQLPLAFVLLAKSLFTLEGVAREFDPNFNLLLRLGPIIERISERKKMPSYILKELAGKSEDFALELLASPERLSRFLKKLEKGEFTIKHEAHKEITEVQHSLDKFSERISLAVLLAAIILGVGLLAQARTILPPILGIDVTNIIFIFAVLIALWLVVSLLTGHRHKKEY